MPDIASVLKSEIARIARKEIRAEIESLKKSVSSHRGEIAALKRRSQALEQALRILQKAEPKPKSVPAAEPGKTLRFSAKGLASQRQRLGLSADACALLLGASSQSIYNWEAGQARPQAKHLAAIVAMRGLTKAQAADILVARKAAR